MQRRLLIRQIRAHARENGLTMTWSEGRRHTKVTVGGRSTVIPRHNEINNLTARAILQQIGANR